MTNRKINTIWIWTLLLFLFLGVPLRETHGMTVEEEKKLGEKILFEMERNVDWVKDPILQGFINQIGYSLASEAGPNPFEFKFYLIKGADPNAYAIPGGHIFLTTGLLILAENEYEVAGVLSHEISHVLSRHVAQMIQRAKRLNIASMAAVIAGMLLGGGGKVSEAVATTALATAEALALKYTREMEVEADQQGLQLMVKGRYDPNGLITFMTKIHKMSLTTGPQIPAYLSTHPVIGDRISLMANLLQAGPKSLEPLKTYGFFKAIQTRVFVEEREPHVAVNHFQSMVDSSPNEVEGYYGLGLAYRKMGRLDKSIEAFQKVSSIAPSDRNVLRELGIVFFLSGKLDEAVGHLEAITAPSGAGGDQIGELLGLYYLGRCYQEKGDQARALPLFLKVKKGYPDFMDVYHSLGSAYGRLGQKGLSHFNFGTYFKIRGDRKNATLHFRTSLDWLERGSSEREEAQKEIRKLTGSKS